MNFSFKKHVLKNMHISAVTLLYFPNIAMDIFAEELH